MILEANNIFLRLALLFSLFFLYSCNREQEATPLIFKGETMGTTYSVKYFGEDDSSQKLKELVDARLIELNKAFSTYDKESEISQLNNNHMTERKIFLSDDLFIPLENAFLMASKSKGVFDPTIGPLVNLWGFGPGGKKKEPSQKEIDEARGRVGYLNLFLDPLDFSLVKKQGSKNIYIDLSATAKGYAVDKIVELLFKQGIRHMMVEIGGEIKTLGKKGDSNWKVAIETPDPSLDNKSIQKVLEVSEMAIATSGNYRNFFENEEGKKFSHTIDYKTGKPVDWVLASVTVLDLKSCMNADSWATALMALGPKKGMELADKYKIAALFIYSESGKVDGKFVEKKTQYFDEVLKSSIKTEEEGE